MARPTWLMTSGGVRMAATLGPSFTIVGDSVDTAERAGALLADPWAARDAAIAARATRQLRWMRTKPAPS